LDVWKNPASSHRNSLRTDSINNFQGAMVVAIRGEPTAIYIAE